MNISLIESLYMERDEIKEKVKKTKQNPKRKYYLKGQADGITFAIEAIKKEAR